VYAHGSFVDVLRFRVHELPPILALDLGALPRTLGLFALGMAVWRSGLFERPREHARLLGVMAAVGLLAGGGITLAGVESLGVGGQWGQVVDEAAALALAFGYGAVVLLGHELAPVRRALAVLVPLGRMALTNYLGQSVIFGFVFYGYGLGLFGRMAIAPAALLGVAVYAAQVAASTWWLRRFRFGPVEWLWRSATYAAWQPLRVAASKGATDGAVA
jgi:uncharacterized protein